VSTLDARLVNATAANATERAHFSRALFLNALPLLLWDASPVAAATLEHHMAEIGLSFPDITAREVSEETFRRVYAFHQLVMRKYRGPGKQGLLPHLMRGKTRRGPDPKTAAWLLDGLRVRVFGTLQPLREFRTWEKRAAEIKRRLLEDPFMKDVPAILRINQPVPIAPEDLEAWASEPRRGDLCLQVAAYLYGVKEPETFDRLAREGRRRFRQASKPPDENEGRLLRRLTGQA